MKLWKWLNLQLFADGAGDGGAADGGPCGGGPLPRADRRAGGGAEAAFGLPHHDGGKATLRLSVDINHVPAGSTYPSPGRTFFASLDVRL